MRDDAKMPEWRGGYEAARARSDRRACAMAMVTRQAAPADEALFCALLVTLRLRFAENGIAIRLLPRRR